MFSLRAPTQPKKLRMNMDMPTTMKSRAGSRVMLVSLLMFWNMSFSDQAHSPMASMMRPTL